MRPTRPFLAGVAALAVTAGVLATSPAHAVDGPQARDDVHLRDSRGPVTINVLANDSWDETLDATVTDVKLRWFDDDAGIPGYVFARAAVGGGLTTDNRAAGYNEPRQGGANLVWTPEGDITVTFDDFMLYEQPSAVRYTELIYTLTDSLGQKSTAVALVGDRNPDTTPLTAVDDVEGRLPSMDNHFETRGMRELDVEASWEQVKWVNVHQPIVNDVFGDVEDVRIEIMDTSADLEVRTWTSGSTRTSAERVSYRLRHGAVPASELTDTRRIWNTVTRLSDARTSWYDYRICSASTSECSDTARYTINYRATKTSEHDPVIVNEGIQFWSGGAAEDTLDLRDVIRRDDSDRDGRKAERAELLAQLDAGTITGVRAVTSQEASMYVPDPRTFAPTSDPFVFKVQRPGAGFVEYGMWVLSDSDGTHIGSVRVWTGTLSADIELVDTEAWAAVGQTIRTDIGEGDRRITPGLVDDFSARWAGTSDMRGVQTFGNGHQWLSDPEYGALRENFVNEQGDLLHRVAYDAGLVPGTDVLIREWCGPGNRADLPSLDEFCSTATLTVHVSPLNAAQDDAGRTMPAQPVKVDVLGNDVYTDTPFMMSRIAVLEDSVPAGVEVEVTEDREVVVTAPARFEGETVEFGYELTDFTRSSRAMVRVEIGEVTAPEPTPTPEPTPEPTPPVVTPSPTPEPPVVTPTPTPEPTPPVVTPSPEPTPPVVTPTPEPPVVTPTPEPPVVKDPPAPIKGPKAKADTGRAMVDLPVVVSVLKNDRYTGKATVTLGKAPKGVKATVMKDGRVKVTASQRWANKTVKFSYTLTDASGKKSTTTVKVTVDPIPIIVTGADRVATAADTDTGTPAGFMVAGLGLGAAGLMTVGALWLRRRRGQ